LRNYFRILFASLNIILAVALLGSYASNRISPEQIWYIAFLGLIYPLLLFANIFFILFWLWRKKWFFLISLITIIAGLQNISRFIQFRLFKNDDIKLANTVKTISYNVRLFNLYQWEEEDSTSYHILNFVKEQNPSVICFQEFVTTKKQITEKYIDTILREYPYKHVYYTYKLSPEVNYGLATYSRFPIARVNSTRFMNTSNAFIYSDIVIGSDTIRVFNVHLQSIKLDKKTLLLSDSTLRLDSRHISEAKIVSGRLKVAYIKRAQQADELRWHIVRSPYPVIVLGDFNDTPVSYSYNTIRGDLQDAFTGSGEGLGSTYRGIFPTIRIDYIFHSESLTSFNYRTYRVNLSDHFPISCEFYPGN